MDLQEKLEQQQDKRMENEELKRYKERFEKTMEKNKVQKFVMYVVKAVVVPMLFKLLNILALVIAVCAVASLITSIFSGGGNGNSDEENYSASGSYGSTNVTAVGNLNLTEQEIIDFIEAYETDNISVKEQLKENVSEIHNWQETYGYTAEIFISIAIEESITNIEEFSEEMNANRTKVEK